MATTTNYGWDTPDDTDLVKDGALAMRDLGGDIDATLYTALGGNYPGLRLVKKQTIGTGVSSVTVTNAFSATYENYKIVMNGCTSSLDNNSIFLKLNNSAGSTYNYGYNYVTFTGTQDRVFANSSSAGLFVGGTGSQANTNIVLDVLSPFLSIQTSAHGQNVSQGTAWQGCGLDKNAASHTAFTLAPGAGTWTGGTIYVYGYGAS